MARSWASRSSGDFDSHEVRDVGDVHAQPPVAVFQSLERNGVVEIAGIDRVDRDDRFVRQIACGPPIDSSNCSASLAGFFQRVVGEIAGQVEFADDRQRIDARRAAGPSTSMITPSPSWNVRREADHLEDDFVVGLGVLRAGIADVDRPREQACRRLAHSRCRPASKYVPTNWCVSRSRISTISPSGLPAADIALARNRDQHRVADGGIARVIGGDEDIAAAIGRRCYAAGAHEAEAGAHAAEDAGDALAREFAAIVCR